MGRPPGRPADEGPGTKKASAEMTTSTGGGGSLGSGKGGGGSWEKIASFIAAYKEVCI